jgi:hypothetical protein
LTLKEVRRRSRSIGDGIVSGTARALDAAAALATDDSPELEAAAAKVLGSLSPIDRETLRATVEDERAPGIEPATFRKRRERAFVRLRQAWRRGERRRILPRGSVAP